MANPQPDKFTKISSEIMDAMCRFRMPGEVRQVVDCVIRKTYGFNKRQDWISNSQFMGMTGMPKGNVCRSLSKAIEHRLVILSDNSYRFNKDYHDWISFAYNNGSRFKVITQDNVINQENVITQATEVINQDNDLLSLRRDTIDSIDNITIDNCAGVIAQDNNSFLSRWHEVVGTQLRTKLPENVNAAIRINNLVGEERFGELLMAVRMIRGNRYSNTGLKIALVNYVGLEKKLEEVESFIQGSMDGKAINQLTRKGVPSV